MRVLGTKILVKRDVEEKTKSGIILTNEDSKNKASGVVVTMGKGQIIDGVLYPVDVKVNDRVYFGIYAGSPVKYKDEDFLVIDESDIHCVVENEDLAVKH